MVSIAGAYGSYTPPTPYRPTEPPGIAQVRSSIDHALNQVLREFANRSAHATELGIKAIESGDYITLDALETLINQR